MQALSVDKKQLATLVSYKTLSNRFVKRIKLSEAVKYKPSRNFSKRG